MPNDQLSQTPSTVSITTPRHWVSLVVALLLTPLALPEAFASQLARPLRCFDLASGPTSEVALKRIRDLKYASLRTLRGRISKEDNAQTRMLQSALFQSLAGSLHGANRGALHYWLEASASRMRPLRSHERLQDLQEAASLRSEQQRFQALHRWVQSPEDAVLVYGLLSGMKNQFPSQLIEGLVRVNPHFGKARLVKDHVSSLITYSFEKEGRGPEVGLLFRPKRISPERWNDMSPSDQLEALLSLRGSTLSPRTHLSVVATDLKPSYLALLASESGDVWEVRHQAFELDPRRLMRQLRELTSLFRSTDSVHVHLVFDLALGSPRSIGFSRWFKFVNDALVLRGLENGLHPSGTAGIDSLSRHRDTDGPIQQRARAQRPDEETTESEIPTFYGTKMLSMGLRPHTTYTDLESVENIQIGQPARPNPGALPWPTTRIGLELRDVTRKMQDLEETVDGLSHAIQGQFWNRFADSESDSFFALDPDTKAFDSVLAEAVDLPPYLNLRELYPGSIVPLHQFEDANFPNYRTGTVSRASASQRRVFIEARAEYIKGLEALGREIKDLQRRRVPFSNDDVISAIKMLVAEWATKTKPSTLLVGF